MGGLADLRFTARREQMSAADEYEERTIPLFSRRRLGLMTQPHAHMGEGRGWTTRRCYSVAYITQTMGGSEHLWLRLMVIDAAQLERKMVKLEMEIVVHTRQRRTFVSGCFVRLRVMSSGGEGRPLPSEVLA